LRQSDVALQRSELTGASTGSAGLLGESPEPAKGAMKDAAGKLLDDKQLQAEGKADKAKGAEREALGDAKDAVKDAKRT
jgi:uncharacterized protein YjbJ (UPF0337 family)